MNDEQNQRTQAVVDELRSLKYAVVLSASLISLAIGASRMDAGSHFVFFAISALIFISLTAVIVVSWFKR
jgi:bacteriorhodopsin